jgi:hypothetical protein
MTISGASVGTINGAKAASSDGVDDVGRADGPQDLPKQSTFGVAFTISDSPAGSLESLTGCVGANSDSVFSISDADKADGSSGEVRLFLRDGANRVLNVEASDPADRVFDNDTHFVVINKSGSSVNFYIDDMIQAAPDIVHKSTGFSPASYSISTDMGFFGLNSSNSTHTFIEHKTVKTTFIEFNEDTYSEQERLDAVKRAPGV